jgi:beta-glucosidase/6-phospho-beta-glucosidase/beta-galactosidase
MPKATSSATPRTPSAEPFLWGAATSGHQVDGDNRHSDWWEWETQGHVEGGVISGRATDHWNRFKEDLKLAADLGLNTYRFSVEWARVEPEKGEWNKEALDWYRALVAECEKHGLVPMATLHHFTSPAWFARKGGFTRPKSPGRFATFVAKAIEAIGPRVPLWCTLNEPLVLAVGGYIGKFMPPAVFSPVDAGMVTHHLLKAHVSAYDLIHRVRERKGPWAEWPLRVGIAHNMVDFLPDRTWHPMERLLTGAMRRFYNRAWLDAVTGKTQKFGIPGLLPAPPEVKEARGRVTADFLGVNYYTKAYVQWRPKDATASVSADIPVGHAPVRRALRPSHVRDRERDRRSGRRAAAVLSHQPSPRDRGRARGGGRHPGLLPLVADRQLRVGEGLRPALRPLPGGLRDLRTKPHAIGGPLPQDHPEEPRRGAQRDDARFAHAADLGRMPWPAARSAAPAAAKAAPARNAAADPNAVQR